MLEGVLEGSYDTGEYGSLSVSLSSSMITGSLVLPLGLVSVVTLDVTPGDPDVS